MFTVDLPNIYNPRPYQVEGLTKIAEYLRGAFMGGYCNPGFVEYSVGYGKTGIYAFIARHVTKSNYERKKKGQKPFKVLVIAHQTELTKQNKDFAQLAGVNATIVASDLNKGKHAKNMNLQDVVFANEKTLENRLSDHESKMFDEWVPDLICIDECHRFNWKDFIKFSHGHNDDEEKPTVYTKILMYFLEKNPKCQILGGSGSPWRDNEWIKGPFWKECIDKMDTMDLVRDGFLVKPLWGASKEHYDFSSIDYQIDETGDKDIDLDQAQKVTSSQQSITESICREIVSLSSARNAVLLFCSGHDHIKETKAALMNAGVSEDQIGVITDGSGFAQRSDILGRAKTGKCKYVLNVGVLTTGVNVPLWDTVCFLRPIGSVVLFTQAVGRGLRLHDNDVKALGYEDKQDCLILDYAGCFERLAHLVEGLSEFEAEYEHKKKEKKTRFCGNCEHEFNGNAIICPKCNHDHGEPKICKGSGRNKGCGKQSRSTARRCEHCHTPFTDPNEKLSGKHYRKHEYEEVEGMAFS